MTLLEEFLEEWFTLSKPQATCQNFPLDTLSIMIINVNISKTSAKVKNLGVVKQILLDYNNHDFSCHRDVVVQFHPFSDI